jgi:hypothetical protein
MLQGRNGSGCSSYEEEVSRKMRDILSLTLSKMTTIQILKKSGVALR